MFGAALALSATLAAAAADGPSLIGIDHIPTVVANLDAASDSYRQLGFALKPGRAHENGLRNNHVKFKDGSGIELLSVPVRPTDSITAGYAKLLGAGEGPAYLAFHARDTGALAKALGDKGIAFKNEGGLIAPTDPRLDFIFFVKDNRSPTDKPEHFAHANGAVAMSAVWLALDARSLASLRKLLSSLGAVEHEATAEVPAGAPAHVFDLQNGQVVVVSADHQLLAGRPIIGARFRVAGQPVAKKCAGDALVKPALAHGLWLCFGSER